MTVLSASSVSTYEDCHLMWYFTYVEITPREHQALWYEYEQVSETFPSSFAQQQLVSAADIYPVFRELFQRRLVT